MMTKWVRTHLTEQVAVNTITITSDPSFNGMECKFGCIDFNFRRSK